MRVAIAVLAMLAVAGTALANEVPLVSSNTETYIAPQPRVEHVTGIRDISIVVYTDDCVFMFDYVIQALNNLGLGYTAYYSDYYGFEAAVATGMYDLILINHDCYYELSYAWDDVYMELMAGKSAVISTFDWDGSNDYSGYVDDVLALNNHTVSRDIYDATTTYVWNMDPIFTGTDGVIGVPNPSYIDDGDAWNWETAESGWTADPVPGEANTNIGDCLRVYFGWPPDQCDPDDAVTAWMNAILFVTAGPSATEDATWGSVKALYE